MHYAHLRLGLELGLGLALGFGLGLSFGNNTVGRFILR